MQRRTIMTSASDGQISRRRSLGTISIVAGLVAIWLGMAAAPSAKSQVLTTLYTFCAQSGCTDGANPLGGLVQGSDGNFYGTTGDGGAGVYCNSVNPPGCGTVFKITPSGALTTLYSFCSQTGCADGDGPDAGLVQGTDGNFYGTTNGGGSCTTTDVCGTIFKITPSGALTTLYSFCAESGCADGDGPVAGLFQGTDGNFYGTTSGGGAGSYCPLGTCGTVFKITPAAALTTLYSFCSQTGCADGYEPVAGLVQGTDGNFYGTTYCGGTGLSNPPCSNGSGTVFRISPNGTLTTLYSFCSQSGCTDGQGPSAGLVQGSDGNFYGTTAQGGANEYNGKYGGTVFKITPSGVLTTLYSFCSQSGCTDGQFPQAGLIQATDGNFYGTAEIGGANGLGTAFRITPTDTLTTLYTFCSQSRCTDGMEPAGELVQGTDGNFYGTTVGGAYNYGTVFKLSVIPVAILSPSTVTFGSQVVDTTSAPQAVTLSNTGNATLTITGVAASGGLCPNQQLRKHSGRG